MSDKTVKVPRGSEVRLTVRGDPPQPEAAKAEPAKRGALDTPQDDDLYAFRKDGAQVLFYEIDPGDGAYHATREEILLTGGLVEAKQREIDAAILAAYVGGSTQELTAKAGELPAETYRNDALAGLSGTRLYVQSAPYGELGYTAGDQKESDRGTNLIRFKGNLHGKGAIRAGDDMIWRSFDTSYDPDFPASPGNDGYKVTAEPSFSAPRVDLKIGGGKVRVYLKKNPRIFYVVRNQEYYAPYPFWSDMFGFVFLKPANDILPWTVGGQFDIRDQFSSFRPPFQMLSYTRFWQAKALALPNWAAQVAADKAVFQTEAEDYFDRLKADNGPTGSGYIWFPLAYSWTTAQREAVPTYYPDIPHGYYLNQGLGTVYSSVWNYEGEFVGGIEYGGRKLYVWRYTTGHASHHVSGLLLFTFEMSSPDWELEPRYVVTDEAGTDHPPSDHYVQDTTRDQHVFIGDPLFADVGFFYGAKYWVDFGTSPREYQS